MFADEEMNVAAMLLLLASLRSRKGDGNSQCWGKVQSLMTAGDLHQAGPAERDEGRMMKEDKPQDYFSAWIKYMGNTGKLSVLGVTARAFRVQNILSAIGPLG